MATTLSLKKYRTEGIFQAIPTEPSEPKSLRLVIEGGYIQQAEPSIDLSKAPPMRTEIHTRYLLTSTLKAGLNWPAYG